MSRVLVTGIAGFIGSHIGHHLIKSGHSVIGVDDLSGGSLENIPSGTYFRSESITDAKFIDALFRQNKFEYVFHLAAYAAEGLSHFIRRYNYENNLIGSVNLINASVNYGVKHFVFTSSMAVYGSAQTPFREDMIPAPEDPYGIAKYAVEMELKTAQKMFGLDYTIFRPHNVYGERQNIGDRYRNVVGIFMNQCLKGEPMTIFGDGTQQRAFSYIDDIAPIICEAIYTPRARNRIFNIGADTPYTINQLAEEIIDASGRRFGDPILIRRLPPRYEVYLAFSDHTQSELVFGKRTKVELCEGLRRMMKWVHMNGSRPTPKFANIEIEQGLPDIWK